MCVLFDRSQRGAFPRAQTVVQGVHGPGVHHVHFGAVDSGHRQEPGHHDARAAGQRLVRSAYV